MQLGVTVRCDGPAIAHELEHPDINRQAQGDILVYMDDDDFYPPDRVLHSVQTLASRPGRLIAGSTTMHIYYKR